MDWIHLIQNRDQWRAIVNTVMNLFFPSSMVSLFGISWVAELLLDSQQGLGVKELVSK